MDDPLASKQTSREQISTQETSDESAKFQIFTGKLPEISNLSIRYTKN